jgi:hypothetical protein
MKTRLPAIAAVTTAAALLLSGCLGIESTTSSQPALLGPVRLTTVACDPGQPGNACTAQTSNGSPFGGTVQLLYAVRLPAGTVAPSTFTATSDDTPAVTTTMTENAGYEQQLQAAAPAGQGQRWWGYLSAPVETSAARVTFALDVTPGRTADGAPAASPLAWRAVVGGRTVSDTLTADRAVDCIPATDPSGTVYTANSEDPEDFASIVCIDSPDPDGVVGDPDLAPFTALALSGAPTSAAAGSTGTLTFTARRSGIDAQSVSLTTAGGPAGATRTPSVATLPLSGDATRTLTVAVAVPATTPAGAYPVTLTATAPGGRTETATATLTVTAAPATPDTTAPVVSKVKVKKGKVKLTSSEPATVKITVKATTKAKPKPKAKKLTRTVRAGKASVKLPRLAPGRYTVVVKATDAAGNKAKRAKRTFTIG